MNTGTKMNHLQKASDCMKKAASASKGGIFSKADPDRAASEYGEAAKAFKAAGSEYVLQYVDALMKSAEEYQKAGTTHTAGRQLEAASQALDGRKGDEEKCAEIMARTADLYRASAHPDRASQNLVKAAKLIGDKDMNKALEYFKEAIDIIQADDRGKFSNDLIKSIIGYLVKHERFAETVDIIRKQNEIYLKAGTFQHYYSQNALALLVLLLHLEQYDKVEQEYKQLQENNALAGDYAEACEELIDALRMADNTQLQATTKKQIFTFLDNEVAKLARTLAIDADKLKALYQSVDATTAAQADGVDLS